MNSGEVMKNKMPDNIAPKFSLAISVILLMFIINPFSFIPVPGHLQAVDSASRSNNNDRMLIPSVPYVWQEINGFCNWAAVTIMLDYYTDIDSNLAHTLSLSGAGWGFSYVRSGPTVMMLPGVFSSQMEDTDFIADLYGLDTCLTILETDENLVLEDYYADLGLEVVFL